MELKPGYKLTEVGVIPEDWSVDAFGDIYAEPSRNGIYKSAEYQGRGIRIVNMGEMFGLDFISDQEMNRISLTSKEIATTGLRDGDLLFGRRSVVPSGAGKCSIVIAPPEPMTFESSIIRVRLNKAEVDPLFHYYFFASSLGRAVMSNIISGTNIKGIRGTELRELKIPRPPLPEQRSIATALSDMDELLGACDRLIAKKCDLKQATLQQLLTGKTRLSGFGEGKGYQKTEVGEIPEDWIVSSLGDRCQVFGRIGFRGYTINDIVEQGKGAIALSPSNIRNSKIDFNNSTYVSFVKYEESPEIKIKNGDILLVKTGSTFGKTAIVRHLTEKATLNPQLVVLKNLKINNFFLGYMMGFEIIQRQISTAIVGGALPTLSQALISQFKFPEPPTEDEQYAITTVLSDMDAEIAALEQRRNKTRALKQAMMQELLTGRIRLA